MMVFASMTCAAAQQDAFRQTNPPQATNQTENRWIQHMDEMDAMVKSMTSKADVCRTRMGTEMRN